MAATISVVTLGVADMDRAAAFYGDGLGFPRYTDKPPVLYFALEGTWLAVFPREQLARFIGVPDAGEGFRAVTLSCNVNERAQVDDFMRRAATAGATTVSAARDFGWGGYGGWFADPDEHLWEVVWNPRPFIGTVGATAP